MLEDLQGGLWIIYCDGPTSRAATDELTAQNETLVVAPNSALINARIESGARKIIVFAPHWGYKPTLTVANAERLPMFTRCLVSNFTFPFCQGDVLELVRMIRDDKRDMTSTEAKFGGLIIVAFAFTIAVVVLTGILASK